MSGGKPDKAASKKRQFLVHIDAELIRRIKILAIDRNVTASSLVEEAMLGYLAASKAAIRRKSGNEP